MNNTGSILLKTPLGFAICKMFSRILPLLKGAPPGIVKVYIFGGCAVHLLTHRRGSEDVDAEIEAAKMVRERDLLAVFNMPQSYQDNCEQLRVYLDQQYSNCLGPLHEDYRERAIPIEGYSSHSPLQIFVAAGVDVAISKLGRFSDRDQQDIQWLIERGRVDVKQFVALATEAIDYAVGVRSSMLSCLKLVTNDYLEEFEDVKSPPT